MQFQFGRGKKKRMMTTNKTFLQFPINDGKNPVKTYWLVVYFSFWRGKLVRFIVKKSI
jgi:hypothetical protein